MSKKDIQKELLTKMVESIIASDKESAEKTLNEFLTMKFREIVYGKKLAEGESFKKEKIGKGKSNLPKAEYSKLKKSGGKMKTKGKLPDVDEFNDGRDYKLGTRD